MTGFNSNINELITKFTGLRANADQHDFSEALLVGVNAARGEMSFRIFNEGKGVDGTPFGKYIGKKLNVKFDKKAFPGVKKELFDSAGGFTAYELKRVKRGRQIKYKDLEFEGALRRGVVSIKENQKRVVCAIPNETLAKIAEGQEKQIGGILGVGKLSIFGLSEQEKETLILNTNEALKQIYVRIFDT